MIQKKQIFQFVSAAMAGAVALSAPLYAQQMQSVETSKDWTVYVDQNNAKNCYVATQPKSSKALRNGETVSVNRGDIRLYVGIKSGATEPSFLAGYPLSPEKAVEVKIGSNSFAYATNPSADAQFAWPQPKYDGDIINAMKAGSDVVVTGMSQRGTVTVDNFSLSGFTAAYNAAVAKCK